MKTKILNLLLFFLIINSKLSAQIQNITITPKVNPDRSIDLFCEKKNPGNYTIGLEFSNVVNCDIKNYKTVIGYYSNFLVKLRPTESNRVISYNLRYYTLMGDLNPKPDTLFTYLLPIKNGRKVKINTAKNMETNYFGQSLVVSGKTKYFTQNVYAKRKDIDTDTICTTCKGPKGSVYMIESKTPDTICSMRKGTVVKIIDGYGYMPSFDSGFTNTRNTIIIEHADGTLATYTGFNQNKIFIKLGETVYPQTELGVMELFNTGIYRVDFAVYFYQDKDFKSHDNVTMKDYWKMRKLCTPYFVTQVGNVKPESGEEYIGTSSEDIIIKEFSRSEKKKYTKNQAFFK